MARAALRATGRTRGRALALTVLAALGMAPAALAVVNNPPAGGHAIIAFPQRDFVSADGYAADDLVVVKLIHPDGTTWSTDPADPIEPQADPRAQVGDPFAGIVEVNHPGGACWVGATPDIRPGDVVELDVVAGPAATLAELDVLAADATTVSNVVARRPVQTGPGTIQIHGTARDAAGNPLPIDELEQRLVVPRDQFDLNGRRTLRAASDPAAGDGVLAYDAPGSASWTATYTGLDARDVTRALGAESRGMWLGADPAAANEATIYEIGAAIVPGPSAPCDAPLEILPPPPGSELVPPTMPTNLSAAVSQSNTVTLSWTASTDNVGVTSYGIYRNGVAIANVQRPDGAAPAPTTYADRNVPAGDYVYTVDAADAIGNRSAQSDPIPATTTSQLASTVPANEPPVAPTAIIAFPSRDFVSSEGFEASDTVDVELIRDGVVVSTADGVTPQADPRALDTDPFAGIVEVNHPGGVCWDGVTPEMRPGDVIRTTAYAPDGTVRTVDQITVSDVTATRVTIAQDDDPDTGAPDGVIEIHGTAADENGDPLPIDQIEQRLVAGGDRFDLSGKRTLRAAGPGLAGDGVLTYDAVDNPTGTRWTARYVGLSADDVARAAGGVSSSTGRRFDGAESRVLWLGRDPLAGVELTIFENSDLSEGGPSAGFCTSPLEAADVTAPTTPTDVTVTQTGADTVDIAWSPSSDDYAVRGYRIYRDGGLLEVVSASHGDYTDHHVPPGLHAYAVSAFDTASPRGPGGSIIARLLAGLGQPYGNESALSDEATITQADVTAPRVPHDLDAVTGMGTVTLTWAPSEDDVATTGYGVYRDGMLLTEVADPTYVDSGLMVGTYAYTIDAFDAAGNRSAQSSVQQANVTEEADVTAPDAPTGLTATNSPDIHGRDVALTWNAASDPINPAGGTPGSGVTAYGVYRNGVRIAQVPAPALAYLDANRPAGTFSYTVDAVDSAGNRSAQSDASVIGVANDPPLAPHSLIAFPARDFISATGYAAAEGPYTFTLIRDGRVFVSTSQTSDADGVIEVNHPGGVCWTVNTPDMRPGDVIRITNAAGVTDQTTVANVTAERPIAINSSTIVIHGTAQDASGNPIPVDQLEHRLIANRDAFALNGRRTLRAGIGLDGSLAYDAPGSTHWTATYTGLSATDVVRATGGTTASGTVFVGAESRGIWLGRDPLALTEQTIYENGPGVAGGPPTPDCTAPLEPGRPAASTTPASVVFVDQSAVPASTSAPRTVQLANGGDATLHLDRVYLAGANPGDFAIGASTCGATLAQGATCTVSVTFSPTALGLRQAYLGFADDAANTTDQAVPLTGTGIDASAPSLPGAPLQSLVAGAAVTIVPASLATSTVPVRIGWNPSVLGTVTAYQVQVSTSGGAYVDTAIQPGLATSLTLPLQLGTTAAPRGYQFRVRACNNANCTAWVTGAAFATMPVDESDKALVSFGGKGVIAALGGAYAGSTWSASTNKEKAQLPNKTVFTVSGSIAWLAVKGPNRGQASVSVDGGAPVVVDLYAPVQQMAVMAFTANGLASGRQHSVVVQVLGTRNAASTGNRVDVDGFVLIK